MITTIALILLCAWSCILSVTMMYLMAENESRYREILRLFTRVSHCEDRASKVEWRVNDHNNRLNRFEDDGK